MDVMELGAIGELVGGVAVIASLVYVGLQVRQSNAQARQRNSIERAQAAREVTRDYNEIFLAMTDPEFVEVFRKGMADFGSLPQNDQARLHNWLHTHLLHGISTFLVEREGLVDENYADRWAVNWASMVRSPGLRQWWQQVKSLYHLDYVSHIDRLLESDAAPPPIGEAIPWWGPDATAVEL